MLLLDSPPPDRHTLWEDVHGILVGTTLVALGIQFLRASGLFTGQIAGLALVLGEPTGIRFGLLFFLLNAPFYILAVKQLGWRFTIKSFISVVLMSSMVDLMPTAMHVEVSEPLAAALFGVCAGLGLLSLFRHGATLGGGRHRGALAAGHARDQGGLHPAWLRPAGLRLVVPVFCADAGALVAAGSDHPQRAHSDQPPPRSVHRALLRLHWRWFPEPRDGMTGSDTARQVP
ncbi:YitT family protein [Alloyangia mangrovi]|uniref:YitT family protein n=1 Tax=Alloyangia mangrovi TaxID=1779329 RepID=UPI004058A40F